MNTILSASPNTTIRHYSLIAMAEMALQEARLNYACAWEAYLNNKNVETAGAAYEAEYKYEQAQADHDQARLLFKQLRMQRVVRD